MVHISKLFLKRTRKLHIIYDRNGVSSFNVIGTCDFDVLFTFVMVGSGKCNT